MSMFWVIVDSAVVGPPAKKFVPAPGGACPTVGKPGEPYWTTVKLDVRLQPGIDETMPPSVEPGPSSALQFEAWPPGVVILLITPPATFWNSVWPPMLLIPWPSPMFQTP